MCVKQKYKVPDLLGNKHKKVGFFLSYTFSPKEEISSFYLGGRGVKGTCEKNDSI